QLKGVVLIARTYGCHQPADAKLSATAEGLINGKRRSIPLELHGVGSGVYAIKQEWPSEGAWVIALTGDYNSMTSSVLVRLGENGQVMPGTSLKEGNLKGVHATGARRKWIAQEIDSALRTPAGITSQAGDADNPVFSAFGPITWLVAGLGASIFTMGLVKRARHPRPSNETAE
ncbi:MAG: hypothetical protein WAV47_09595, partial [Blastocatellia bacterium]